MCVGGAGSVGDHDGVVVSVMRAVEVAVAVVPRDAVWVAVAVPGGTLVTVRVDVRVGVAIWVALGAVVGPARVGRAVPVGVAGIACRDPVSAPLSAEQTIAPVSMLPDCAMVPSAVSGLQPLAEPLA